MYSYNPYYYEYLAHHGVKGQKWGVRRYQPYTSGHKGVFKNLKRTYKSSVRSLRKARKRYEKEGDELAVAGANKAIKDTKKAYKSELKGLKKEFREETRAQYIQDVSERGNEKQIAKVRKEMTPEQLDYAVRRLNAYKDWEKQSMRDVEQEVKNERSMEKLKKIAQGAAAVTSVAQATTSVLSAAKSFKELFPKAKTEHELQMERYQRESAKLALEQQRESINKSKADTAKVYAETNKVNKEAYSNYKKAEADHWNSRLKYYNDKAKAAEELRGKQIDNNLKLLKYYDSKDKNKNEPKPQQNQPKPQQTESKPQQNKPDSSSRTEVSNVNSEITRNAFYDSKDPGFSSLSKEAQAGVKAYERAKASGKSEAMAEKNRVSAIIMSMTDTPRVPVSVARKGTDAAYDYIIKNSENYETKTVDEALEWVINKYKK